jgi:hypothetical protein
MAQPSKEIGVCVPVTDASDFTVAFRGNFIFSNSASVILGYTFLSTSLICNRIMGLVAALSSVQKIPVQPGSISEVRILVEYVEAVR